MGGHPVTVAPVDDHRVGGAEALGGAGRVRRGVAAAIDDDLAAERLLVGLHRLEHDGVQDARGLAGWDVGQVPADVGTDREERRVEAAFGHRFLDVGHLAVELELDTHRQDAVDLGEVLFGCFHH